MESAQPLHPPRRWQPLAFAHVESASPPRDSAGVVAPPPLIYLGGLAVGFALEALLPGSSVPAAVQWVLGGVLLVAGLALLGSFNTAFQRKGTAVEPWKPTTAIVTDGPLPAHPQPRLPGNGARVHRHRVAG